MTAINPLYKDFKPFSYYQNLAHSNKKKNSYVPLIGSVLGAGLSYAYYAKKYKGISEKDIGALKTGFKMIMMCLSAIVGGVSFGSIGAKSDSIQRKVKEGAFQMMNMAIPMTFVSMFHHVVQNVKALDKTAIKIIGSFVAMISGAALATIITNATRDKDQPRRKYSIKDSTANFDDVVATIAIGFGRDLTPVQNTIINSIVPFIYAYNGMRAGRKE